MNVNDQSIELRHLRYFVAVAEELHFGRAARRLHIAQPPLSQQIRRLEDALGHRLFTRSSRLVQLTAAGEMLLERARHTLQKVGDDLEMARSVGRGEVGLLSIGFVGSAMLTSLPAVLQRYRSRYPKVQLRLREFYTSGLLEALMEGSVDVGFLRDADPTDELHIETWRTEPFVAVLPKDHPLARKSSFRADLLKGQPFVLFSRSVGRRAWEQTMAVCERRGFRPNVVQEAPHWLTILRLVGAGIGVTIAPACVERIRGADVVCRKLLNVGVTSEISLAYRSEFRTTIADAFCGMARHAGVGESL